MTRTPLLQFAGALALLLIVVALNIVWYNVVLGENANVTTLIGEVKAKSDDSTRSAVAKSELASLSTDQSSMQQYFVSTSDVVPFLQQLQTTGSYLGSNVQVVSVSATPGTPYGTLSLALTIAGSFNSVMRTLGSIEYGPYDTTIDTLTFSAPSSSGSTTPQWTANALFTVGTEVSSQVPAVVIATSTPVTSTPTASPAATTTATAPASEPAAGAPTAMP